MKIPQRSPYWLSATARRMGLSLLVPLLIFVGATGLATAQSDPIASRLTVAIDPVLPEIYFNRLLSLLIRAETVETAAGPVDLYLLDRTANAAVAIAYTPVTTDPETHIFTRYFAPVAAFSTVDDATSLEELTARWQEAESPPLLVARQEAYALETLFGVAPGPSVVVTRTASIRAVLEADPTALAILPFEQLEPRLKVLTLDGLHILDNRLEVGAYPLAVAIAAQGTEGGVIAGLLRDQIPNLANREPDRLTTLMMTGVTAMSRVTAAKMEANGYTYPALVISDTVAAADITHISNEVPFLDDCVVNAAANNLILCSHTNYWAALEALGTDIVGLSGNHVNDFGREGARRSISWYRENEIPIYGSGLTLEEACAPLRWEHNGNSFAFIAALAFEPRGAWATEEEPGACYYYDNKEMILASVAELSGVVDIVAVELQYLETYNPYPTIQQVAEFREIRTYGADIVTGVQSHVPQAMEPYGATDPGGNGIIVYGLGNLFFDQMWSWQTRTELLARHTIYDGRLLSTEILTAVLEDWAQPRWATESERRDILTRIFGAAPARP